MLFVMRFCKNWSQSNNHPAGYCREVLDWSVGMCSSGFAYVSADLVQILKDEPAGHMRIRRSDSFHAREAFLDRIGLNPRTQLRQGGILELRIRSRVSPKFLPTSSSVFGSAASSPNRCKIILRSRSSRTSSKSLNSSRELLSLGNANCV